MARWLRKQNKRCESEQPRRGRIQIASRPPAQAARSGPILSIRCASHRGRRRLSRFVRLYAKPVEAPNRSIWPLAPFEGALLAGDYDALCAPVRWASRAAAFRRPRARRPQGTCNGGGPPSNPVSRRLSFMRRARGRRQASVLSGGETGRMIRSLAATTCRPSRLCREPPPPLTAKVKN
jgi:hypothetical protein